MIYSIQMNMICIEAQNTADDFIKLICKLFLSGNAFIKAPVKTNVVS